MIIYTDFLPAKYDGISAWPFVLIRPAHKDDIGLREHELVHYRRQAWITPVWFLQYWFSKNFRLAEEALAYRTSIKFGMPLDQAVAWLMTYGADEAQARALLTPVLESDET